MKLDTEANGALGRRAKIGSIVAVAVVVVLLLLESTLLRGEQVARATVGLGPNEAETLAIDRVGQKHVVEIDTRRRRRGETVGRAIKIRLEDPSGAVVYEDSEWTAREERFFSFTPKVVGPYSISIQPSGVLSGSSSGTASVRVFVGDRRVLSRLFAALPF